MNKYTVVLYRQFDYEGSHFCGVYPVLATDKEEAERLAIAAYKAEELARHPWLDYVYTDGWESTIFMGHLKGV